MEAFMKASNWNLSAIEKWLAMAIILVIVAIGMPRLLGSRVSASQGPTIHLKQTLSTAGSEYSTLRKIYSRQVVRTDAE